MSFGDPDFRPNKAMKRQHYTQNSEKVRLAFKMRCKACNARLVKETYYVDKPVDPEIEEIYRNFYAHDHFCSECSPSPSTISYKAMMTEKNAYRYRGRGG